MKRLQHFQKRKSVSMDNGVGTLGSENKNHNGKPLKKYIKSVAGRIRNYCLYMLVFLLSGYAVIGKIKNSWEKNILTTKEGFKILRVIFIAARRLTPPHPQKIQSKIVSFVDHLSCDDFPDRILTQLKTFTPALLIQIDTISMPSEAVVWVLWLT